MELEEINGINELWDIGNRTILNSKEIALLDRENVMGNKSFSLIPQSNSSVSSEYISNHAISTHYSHTFPSNPHIIPYLSQSFSFIPLQNPYFSSKNSTFTSSLSSPPYSTSKEYMKGVQMGAFAMVLSSFLSSLFSFFAPALLRMFSPRLLFSLSLLISSCSSLVFFLLPFSSLTPHRVYLVFLLYTLAFSTTFAFLHALCFLVLSENIPAPSENGLFAGILNCFGVAGQSFALLLSALMQRLVHIWTPEKISGNNKLNDNYNNGCGNCGWLELYGKNSSGGDNSTLFNSSSLFNSSLVNNSALYYNLIYNSSLNNSSLNNSSIYHSSFFSFSSSFSSFSYISSSNSTHTPSFFASHHPTQWYWLQCAVFFFFSALAVIPLRRKTAPHWLDCSVLNSGYFVFSILIYLYIYIYLPCLFFFICYPSFLFLYFYVLFCASFSLFEYLELWFSRII